MTVTLQLNQVHVPPGQRLVLDPVSWQQFEEILSELGDRRSARIAYDRGTLEIRMPLPEHEKSKVILGDLVKALLDELDLDYVSFGSTTFKRQDLGQGFEPDDCFYIRHYPGMVGKKRLNLEQDPPPDLAIEVDLTSRTQLEIYRSLGVPELWRLQNGRLRIDLLQDGAYSEAAGSPIFGRLPLSDVLPRFIAMAETSGPRTTLKLFRTWVQQQISGGE